MLILVISLLSGVLILGFLIWCLPQYCKRKRGMQTSSISVNYFLLFCIIHACSFRAKFIPFSAQSYNILQQRLTNLPLIIIRQISQYAGFETKDEDIEIPMFNLITITTATENFSLTNIIGEGGFGIVYKVRKANI